ncbi:1-phosphofructokinase [Leuconostoc gasicomitatum]|uniref:1-phosphofructokinase n=1 Tax=Leuconostoc gasicomitatum TaxID=115778 RepID=UPI001CC783FB|nr:1-phosphofructokinase [Leuconostoc gasicomitatum]MBZ5981215.1 1-phosphofructokinase [Leuconostoc gasicomitatum]
MIYTVTLNPSLDFITRLKTLTLGETNRADSETIFPGGKGINVSRLLGQLAIDNTAWGFLGGFTGQHLQNTLRDTHLTQDFTQIAGSTRINLKIKATNETEINATGPAITAQELAIFFQKFDCLTHDDVVVLSGSVPKRLDSHVYQQMLHKIQLCGARFVIDTTGQQLKTALADRPLLVKPNRRELAQLYDTDLATQADLLQWGRQLIVDGAQHAIVSLAGEGALLFTQQTQYFAKPIKGQVQNSAGAGDSMIAGFIGTWLQSEDVLESFKIAVASGTATAFSNDIATKQKIEEIYQQVIITTI